MNLALVHARYQFLETVRVPVAVVGNVVFPALVLLFFVAPDPEVGGDPVVATAAVGQISVFAVLAPACSPSVSGSPRIARCPGTATCARCRPGRCRGWPVGWRTGWRSR